MIDRKFFEPKVIERWCVVIYERQQRFGMDRANHVVNGLIKACETVGKCILLRDDVRSIISALNSRHASRREGSSHLVQGATGQSR